MVPTSRGRGKRSALVVEGEASHLRWQEDAPATMPIRRSERTHTR
jgi:hypothetical protein